MPSAPPSTLKTVKSSGIHQEQAQPTLVEKPKASASTDAPKAPRKRLSDESIENSTNTSSKKARATAAESTINTTSSRHATSSNPKKTAHEPLHAPAPTSPLLGPPGDGQPQYSTTHSVSTSSTSITNAKNSNAAATNVIASMPPTAQSSNASVPVVKCQRPSHQSRL
ncbi:hypothetical protein DL93DRAFT_550815 [Clavulina sp. PMI_390]|nr:hypothetical protein DL93DRAFT_550815 [Clavulina sp. PMI_390]